MFPLGRHHTSQSTHTVLAFPKGSACFKQWRSIGDTKPEWWSSMTCFLVTFLFTAGGGRGEPGSGFVIRSRRQELRLTDWFHRRQQPPPLLLQGLNQDCWNANSSSCWGGGGSHKETRFPPLMFFFFSEKSESRWLFYILFWVWYLFDCQLQISKASFDQAECHFWH